MADCVVVGRSAMIRTLGLARRRGIVAVLTAVCLLVLLGVLALVIDVGILWGDRRRAQAAADSAALAAAAVLFRNFPADAGAGSVGDPAGAAREIAAANGYTNDGTNSTVDVHIPPTSGLFTAANALGGAGYAEVIITSRNSRQFSNIFGTGRLPVNARAVARGLWVQFGDPEFTDAALIALDPTSRAALNAHGGGAVNVNGAVIVNSNHAEAALLANGTNAVINATHYDVNGGYSATGGAHINGTINTGAPPVYDPLGYLPEPALPSSSLASPTNIKASDASSLISQLGLTQAEIDKIKNVYTLVPGRYDDLPNFGNGDLVVLGQASANGAGGIYYLNGPGLKFTGDSILALDPNTSGGIMLYNKPDGPSDTLELTGGRVTLHPLTSGPYQGISIFQDRNSEVFNSTVNPYADIRLSITGNGLGNITGTIYTADGPAKIEGNGDLHLGSQYIAKTLDIGGNGTLNIDYPSSGSGSGGSTIGHQRSVTLVEGVSEWVPSP